MNIDIKLHKNDLPDDLNLGNLLAIDCEFMGLNVGRDPLCLIQISTGNNDAHIIQLNRSNYNAPNLVKILSIYSAVLSPGRIPGIYPPYFLKFSDVSFGLNTIDV